MRCENRQRSPREVEDAAPEVLVGDPSEELSAEAEALSSASLLRLALSDPRRMENGRVA